MKDLHITKRLILLDFGEDHYLDLVAMSDDTVRFSDEEGIHAPFIFHPKALDNALTRLELLVQEWCLKREPFVTVPQYKEALTRLRAGFEGFAEGYGTI